MMGLALGVDYALLMVSRFREELAAGKSPADAARLTRRTAGRTTIFAGSTLLISMLVSIFILPGSLLASLAGTVAMVVVLSVTVATVVGPALLILVGPNINRWRIGAAPERPLAPDGPGHRRAEATGRGGAADRRRRAGPRGAGDRAQDRPAQPRAAAAGTRRPARTPN